MKNSPSISSFEADKKDNIAVVAELWNKQCECQFHRRRAEDMKLACSKAVTLDEGNAMNHARLGEALKMLEEFEEAVRSYQRAHDLDEGNREIRQGFQKAQVALKQSKTKNYYKILGVTRGASTKEIKKAYRKKALEWHPVRLDLPRVQTVFSSHTIVVQDKHADAGEEAQDKARTMFQDVAEAYEILSNEELRTRYDNCEDVSGNPESQQQRRHL